MVDKDGITLDGGGSAVIDGSTADAAAIAVIGHQNVTIRGLTVQNGLHGVRLAGGAAAVLEGTVVATGNARHGVLVEQNSHASVRGMLEANNNDGDGILLAQSSSAQFGGGASIEAIDNGENGLNVTNGSSAAFIGWGKHLEGLHRDVQRQRIEWDSGFSATLPSMCGTTVLWAISQRQNNVGDVAGWGLYVEGTSAAFFGSPSSETSSKLVLSNNGRGGAGVFNNGSLILRLPSEIKGNTVRWNSGLGQQFGLNWIRRSANDDNRQRGKRRGRME